jgi:hypothetical protein
MWTVTANRFHSLEDVNFTVLDDLFDAGVRSAVHAVASAAVSVEVRKPTYRQPGLLCTPRNFARSSKFLGKKYFL